MGWCLEKQSEGSDAYDKTHIQDSVYLVGHKWRRHKRQYKYRLVNKQADAEEQTEAPRLTSTYGKY